MRIRRYDTYGFRTLTLVEAARFVERVLGLPMQLRDSSYRGLYYAGGPGPGLPYLLEDNDEDNDLHAEFAEFGVTFVVSDVPDMDGIRDKLTAQRTDPVLLRSTTYEDDDDNDDDDP